MHMHNRKACRVIESRNGRAEIVYLSSGRRATVNVSDLYYPTEPGEPGKSRNMRIWEAHVSRRKH